MRPNPRPNHFHLLNAGGQLPPDLAPQIEEVGRSAFLRLADRLSLDGVDAVLYASPWTIPETGLVGNAPDGHSEARVIGAIHDYLFAPDDPEAVCERLAHPATRIVSLTVTEGGYSLNNATGEFDPAGDVLHDLQPGAVPRSVFGFLTEGLRRRRAPAHRRHRRPS